MYGVGPKVLSHSDLFLYYFEAWIKFGSKRRQCALNTILKPYGLLFFSSYFCENPLRSTPQVSREWKHLITNCPGN